MTQHFCEVQYAAGEFVTRPGWRVRCHYCKTYHYTDQTGEEGQLDAERVKLVHEETGAW